MKKLVRFFVVIMQRYLPDAFVFAAILTFIAFGAALAVSDASLEALFDGWGKGLWGILEFAMQMVLVVVTGHTMASSRPIKRLLAFLASIPRHNAAAGMVCFSVSAMCCFINWGFGLVVAALLARELARRVPDMDYGYVVAAGYAGFVIWHGGLSGSIPLAVATEGHLFESLVGVIPTTQTIFAWQNLVISALMFATLPLVFKFMAPTGKDIRVVDPALLKEAEEVKEPVDKTPAEKLEYCKFITWLLGAMGAVYLGYYFWNHGIFKLSLNIVIFIFMWAGFILHGTPIAYVRAASAAIRSAAGIVILFPLYGGIQGIILSSGLGTMLAGWFISASTQFTFPLLTFIAGGIVNIFVPSGGGQWAMQGYINLSAGLDLGVNPAKVAMSVAYGIQWTNMIQPFWALPLLGIAKLGPRDIMGYCVIVLLWTGLIMGGGLLFLPW